MKLIYLPMKEKQTTALSDYCKLSAYCGQVLIEVLRDMEKHWQDFPLCYFDRKLKCYFIYHTKIFLFKVLTVRGQI